MIINTKLLQMSVYVNISYSEGMRRYLCWIKVTFLNVWQCSQYFGLRALVMSLSHSGATCALRFDTLLTAHYCLSNTKAKGQLLFVTRLILCFFLAYSSDKGIVFLITTPLSKVSKEDKSQGLKHISLWRIICMLNMHINYLSMFKKTTDLRYLSEINLTYFTHLHYPGWPVSNSVCKPHPDFSQFKVIKWSPENSKALG